MKQKQKEAEKEVLISRSDGFSTDACDFNAANTHEPALDEFYGPLENYVRMITGGYKDLFMLDARGGLGKTYNVRRVLDEELDENDWTHQKGFTTPVELYKTLWKAQESGHVLFLDDMSGLRHNQKAIDMLKAATETDGEENWVQYRSSQSIEHPYKQGEELPQTFCFRGSIIMSFNDTPDNKDFDALKDRGIYYELDFDYDERLELIREVAKVPHFSPLSVEEQQQVAEWIASVTNESFEVSVRTLDDVCSMRHYGQMEGEDWQELAFEVFDLDYEKHLIIRLFEDTDLSVQEQIQYFTDKTGRSERYYYKLKNEIKAERMD